MDCAKNILQQKQENLSRLESSITLLITVDLFFQNTTSHLQSFQNKQTPIKFSNAYFVYSWISALSHINGIQISIYTSVLVQLCDMSVRNPLVTPIHNGTTCLIFFCRMGDCVFYRIQFIRKSFYKHHIIYTSFVRFY